MLVCVSVCIDIHIKVKRPLLDPTNASAPNSKLSLVHAAAVKMKQEMRRAGEGITETKDRPTALN